ncbi:MAG: chorismate-binding protein [Woeseiaceae bacterium]|nr:chorismate-binding protein [Woeseiaceae bacterium]
MKGTAPRGMTLPEDRALCAQLGSSSKDRAENVMIADMIRNDVGRIAEAGSVRTDDLFRIEKYPTVWQMTSTVRARTGASVTNIFFGAVAMCFSHRCAKGCQALQLIAGLEDTERHIYTGAIGYMAPGRQAQFSVAIRTAFIDKRADQAVYGIGGGIVWSSDAEERTAAECAGQGARAAP